MNILQKFRNPITWVLEIIIKILIKKIFFKNIENNDYNRLISYSLELIPNETFINLFKLFLNIIKCKSEELLNINIFKEILIHSIPLEHRVNILNKAKYLFIFLLIGNILKRSLYLIKNIILLPFKLGVYSFLASLFGIRPDYFLSFFDQFKFNLPNWTYNKLLELHLSWLSWLKDTLQINSITTDTETPLTLPRIKKPNIIPQP